ncbi:L-2-amino-thiazoline-4-carboxylic acid hydrolase [Acidobacteriota bacterium]
MKDLEKKHSSRRDFLTKTVPACAVSCLAAGTALASPPLCPKSLLQEDEHKFDKKLPGPDMTYRRYAGISQQSFIRFSRFLQKELGEEKVIELIKKATEERMKERAQADIKRLGGTDFKSYISIFRDPRMLESLNMEIIEDTDTVFEIKVSDCLSAESFVPFKAGDLGYAAVCWGDYNWASDFNPKIKMVRDKTLMQGHDCCNHKYMWIG